MKNKISISTRRDDTFVQSSSSQQPAAAIENQRRDDILLGNSSLHSLPSVAPPDPIPGSLASRTLPRWPAPRTYRTLPTHYSIS